MRPLESLFVVALVLYSSVIWIHRFRGGAMRPWMALAFGAAVTADALGTALVCVTAADRWAWNFHAVTGTASLCIMALHFAWALGALARDGSAWASSFNRFSVWAWVLWLVSFLSGIPR